MNIDRDEAIDSLIDIIEEAEDDEFVGVDAPPNSTDRNVIANWVDTRIAQGRPFFKLDRTYSSFTQPSISTDVVNVDGIFHLVALWPGRDELLSRTNSAASTVLGEEGSEVESDLE